MKSTVAIDEEHAPFVRLAFELAATGNYTMQRLPDLLTERGLLMRAQTGRPAGPISAKYLARVLRDRYSREGHTAELVDRRASSWPNP